MNLNKYITLVLLIFITNCINAQRDKKYRSKEEDNYYKTRKWTEFIPIDSCKILDFNRPQINIKEVGDYTKFKSIYNWSPLQDSLFNIDLLSDTSYIPNNIAGIPQPWIVKMDTTETKGYIIYTDNKYDDFVWGEQGYWIAIKDQTDWKKYYTGLSVNTPIYLKWDSKLDLYKENNILQIESSLLRLISPLNHHDPKPEYEVIKDGIVTEFLLDSITKDTDNDGLTDIVERKMMLSPYSVDTDKDGISDYLDLNPRFNREITEKSSIYEFVLRRMNYFYDTDTLISFHTKSKQKYYADSIPTYLIVTDNSEIQKMYPVDSRLVIVSKKEFKNYKQDFPNSFLEINISPMFKVNWQKDTYKIKISFMSHSKTYLIKRHKDGWKIKIIGFLIE